MKIIRIEYIDVPEELVHDGRAIFSSEEQSILERFEDEGHEVELENNYGFKPILSLYSDEFLDFIMLLIDKYQIVCRVTDFTDEYTRSDQVFEKFLNKYQDKRKEIENLILYDMTVDDVLDKINKFGMDSITKIDTLILNR